MSFINNIKDLIFRRKPARRRVCVIGWDGVPASLVKQLAQADKMPVFKELIPQGSFKPMISTMPPLSSIAWTTFVTCANPGTHGIFGFYDLARDRYDISFTSSGNIKTQRI